MSGLPTEVFGDKVRKQQVHTEEAWRGQVERCHQSGTPRSLQRHLFKRQKRPNQLYLQVCSLQGLDTIAWAFPPLPTPLTMRRQLLGSGADLPSHCRASAIPRSGEASPLP